jgi:hypothetical protein
MNERFPERQEAAELFVRMLIGRAYDGSIKATMEALDPGPPGRSPAPDRVRRAQWYQGLDEASKEVIAEIVAAAVHNAVFGCLVLLDGMTEGYPLRPSLSDFGLYLHRYSDQEAMSQNQAAESVRVNPNGQAVEMLHDILQRILVESGRKDNS